MKMSFKPLLLSAFITLGFVSFALGQLASNDPNFASVHPSEHERIVAKSQSDDYVIGTEDVLAVNIWKEPEISRTVPVRPDGKITIPLIGDVQASGLTPHKLEESLKEGLKTYVANPEVTVIVQEVKSLKFNIVGEISKPGSYPLSQPMTVLDAIAVGGGLRDFAKGSRIYVLRSNARLPFNYKQVIKGKKLSDNIVLQPGDTIVIP